MLFQKNLQDLIKFSKCAGDPQSFLSSSLAEIKSEIKSQDIRVKTSALLKLYFVPTPHPTHPFKTFVAQNGGLRYPLG